MEHEKVVTKFSISWTETPDFGYRSRLEAVNPKATGRWRLRSVNDNPPMLYIEVEWEIRKLRLFRENKLLRMKKNWVSEDGVIIQTIKTSPVYDCNITYE